MIFLCIFRRICSERVFPHHAFNPLFITGEFTVGKEADDYYAQADVDYATAPGTWKEIIGSQKWIAMYDQGFEAYTTQRLYDAPAMNIATGALTTPPTRWTYPTSEFSLNGESVEAAIQAKGAGFDDPFTKVFWDVN